MHVFEKAGLGKAPFRFVGYEHRTFTACQGAPVQVGGSCDYCGQGLSNFYFVMSADGKRFHVGPDCIGKTGDEGLKKVVKEQERKARRIKSDNDAMRVRGTLAGLLCNETIVETLRNIFSPNANEWHKDTAYQWARWMFANARTSGQKKTIKTIRAMVAEPRGE